MTDQSRSLLAASPKSESSPTCDVPTAADIEAGKRLAEVAPDSTASAAASLATPRSDSARACSWKRTRAEWAHLCYCFGCSVVLFVCAGLAAMELRARPPDWEVESFTIDRIDVPGLWMNGIVAADISACPAYDACGLTMARGCSVCPHGTDINRGCWCSDKGGHPGMVVRANTTTCSLLDACGIFEGTCASCPDDTWVRNGCFCHKPLSFVEIRQQAVDFYDMLVGNDEYPANVRLRTEMRVKNPNYAHALTEPGNVSVRWQGHIIGSSTVKELSLPALGADVIPIEVDVNRVSKDLGYEITEEVLSNGWRLRLQADGIVVAKVMFTEVLTEIMCNLTTEINMDGTSKIVEQDCDYSYNTLGGNLQIGV